MKKAKKHAKIYVILVSALIFVVGCGIAWEVFVPQDNASALSTNYVSANTHRSMQNVVYVSESGGTDVYYMKLSALPTADVTVTITDFTGHNDMGFSPSVITFTPANWDTEVPITVSAIDDNKVEGNIDRSLLNTCTTTDPNYTNCSYAGIVVRMTDNDVAGLTFVESGGGTAVAEGSTTPDTYTVTLKGLSQYISTVTVNLSGGSQLTVTPATLTFSNSGGTWGDPKTVEVRAIDDGAIEGAHTGTITHTTTSGDTNYNNLSAPLTVSITDNDNPGVTVTQTDTSTAVTEGGTTPDTYSMVLLSIPSAEVRITPSISPQITLDKTLLTFTAANWSTPQIITVTAVDDTILEKAHSATITHTAASSDSNYNGIAVASVPVNIADNDKGSLYLPTSTVSVREGGSAEVLPVALSAQPTANVTVSLSTNAALTITPASLTFTNATWATPQNFSVKVAADDSEGSDPYTVSLNLSTASTDTDFDSITTAPLVQVSVTDNDTPGVFVDQTESATIVTEGGATDTYTVVLTTRPKSKVTVTVTPSKAVTLFPDEIIFTGTNWNAPQMVRVTAVDNAYQDGTHSAVISHTTASSDAKYNKVTVSDVTVTVLDNDQPGYSIGTSTPPVTTPPPGVIPPPIVTPPPGIPTTGGNTTVPADTITPSTNVPPGATPPGTNIPPPTNLGTTTVPEVPAVLGILRPAAPTFETVVMPINCKEYLRGVRKTIAPNKIFLNDIKAEAGQAVDSYIDIPAINSLIVKGRTLIIDIEKNVRATRCTQASVIAMERNLQELDLEVIPELENYRTDIQYYVDYKQCRTSLSDLDKQLKALLKKKISKGDADSIQNLTALIKSKLDELEENSADVDFDAATECEVFQEEIEPSTTPILMANDKGLSQIINELVSDQLRPALEASEKTSAATDEKFNKIAMQIADLYNAVEGLTKSANAIAENVSVSYAALSAMGDKFSQMQSQIEDAKGKLLPLVEDTIQVIGDTRCIRRGSDQENMIQQLAAVAAENWLPDIAKDITKKVQTVRLSCRAKTIKTTDITAFAKTITQAVAANLDASYVAELTPFKDVPTNAEYYGAALIADKFDILTQETAKMDETASIEKAAIMISRAAELSPASLAQGERIEEGPAAVDVQNKTAISSCQKDIKTTEVTGVDNYGCLAVQQMLEADINIKGSVDAPVTKLILTQLLEKVADVPAQESKEIVQEALADLKPTEKIDTGNVAEVINGIIEYKQTLLEKEVQPEQSSADVPDSKIGLDVIKLDKVVYGKDKK